MPDIKPFNTDGKKPVKIVGSLKKDLSYVNKFRLGDIKVPSTKIELCYLIFKIEKISKEYGIDYKDVLMVLYLYELGLFKAVVNIEGKTYMLKNLKQKKIIKNNNSNRGKMMYSLDTKGFEIVRNLLSSLDFDSSIEDDNRVTLLENEDEMDKLLEGYFRQNQKG